MINCAPAKAVSHKETSSSELLWFSSERLVYIHVLPEDDFIKKSRNTLEKIKGF
jgi:hypothetical protein